METTEQVELEQQALRARYQQALDDFIDLVRDDPNVIAVIVSGSVAYDVLWEKSDIDLTVVVRDQPLKNNSLCIVIDDITLNAALIPRSHFKRGVETAIGGSFFQSYLANGKFIYTTDESLDEYFEEIRQIGEDDIAQSMLYLAGALLGTLHKVQKWLTARKDPLYAQYFLLKAAEPVAEMELCMRGLPTSRSAIQKAMAFNPELMQLLYQEPMARHLTEAELAERVQRLERYLAGQMPLFQRPVVEYLADGEIKTTSMIAKHFRTEGHFIVDVLDYLAEQGVIDKVSQLVKLTPKSRQSVEEIGYLVMR